MKDVDSILISLPSDTRSKTGNTVLTIQTQLF